MKKKYGWILQEKFLFKGDCRFYRKGGGHTYDISKAFVFNGRWIARFAKLDFETVRKVILDKNGKAKKIAGNVVGY